MRKTVTKTFVVGQSQTDAIQLNELFTLVGVAISGSKISGSLISFLGSEDGTNFYPVFDNSSVEVTLTTTTVSRIYAVDPNAFLGLNYLKARLGTSGSANLQAIANQDILFLCATIK